MWDPLRGLLDWVDIMAGRINSTDIDTGSTTSLTLPAAVGCIVPRASGEGWVAALADGFWSIDFDGSARLIASVHVDQADLRFNDGRCDPAGRFWAGTMALDFSERAGALYRLDPDLSVHPMMAPVSISNGIDWSCDGTTMYYVDSPTRRIDAFDFNARTGAFGRQRTFTRLEDGVGLPDGLVVDDEDGIWVALWEGWRVRRYLPNGTVDMEIGLPVSEVTSMAFAGPDLDQLMITTAWQRLSEDDHARQPLAGSLFRATPGVRGRPAVAFAGA